MTLRLCIRSDFEVWFEQILIIPRSTNLVIAKQRRYDLFFILFYFFFAVGLFQKDKAAGGGEFACTCVGV